MSDIKIYLEKLRALETPSTLNEGFLDQFKALFSGHSQKIKKRSQEAGKKLNDWIEKRYAELAKSLGELDLDPFDTELDMSDIEKMIPVGGDLFPKKEHLLVWRLVKKENLDNIANTVFTLKSKDKELFRRILTEYYIALKDYPTFVELQKRIEAFKLSSKMANVILDKIKNVDAEFEKLSYQQQNKIQEFVDDLNIIYSAYQLEIIKLLDAISKKSAKPSKPSKRIKAI